jgi:hypothetical protein
MKLLKDKRCNHLSSYVVDSRSTSVLVALRQEIVEGKRTRKELGKNLKPKETAVFTTVSDGSWKTAEVVLACNYLIGYG